MRKIVSPQARRRTTPRPGNGTSPASAKPSRSRKKASAALPSSVTMPTSRIGLASFAGINLPPSPRCLAQRFGVEALMTPDVALDEFAGRPILAHLERVTADLDVEARRTAHVEGEHAVIDVATQRAGDRHAGRLDPPQALADIIDLLDLQHQMVQP